MRQLRRDRTLFSLLMNAIRLFVEEDDRLARQPHLREAPDADLLHVQQVADRWLGLAAAYVVRKHRCQVPVAMQLLDELRAEVAEGVPLDEVRRVPLSKVLTLPPGFEVGQ